LILISILFLFWDKEDILTTLEIHISISRPRTVERARDGTSINLLELSDLEKRINPSLFNLPETLTFFCTQAPTQDGGKCSSSRAAILPILRIIR
jgi:hypothetical protein